MINGFEKFPEKFAAALKTKEWKELQKDFNDSKRVLLVGNGGNLAVCDHGAIDIARLTNKSAAAPGSGILASSLINDASHDLWVKNWLEISLRGLDKAHRTDTNDWSVKFRIFEKYLHGTRACKQRRLQGCTNNGYRAQIGWGIQYSDFKCR